MATAISKIETAHKMYRDGNHREALDLYTEALAMAKTKAQKIALHSNRAACYLKLHDFNKAAEECTSVLELDSNHTGALMLRSQTLVTLKDYQSALFDVNRLIELDPSSDVYRNLQSRLKTQLALAPIPESEEETQYFEEEEDLRGEKQEQNKSMHEQEIKPNVQPSINPKIPVPQNKNILAPQNVILKKQDAIAKPNKSVHEQGIKQNVQLSINPKIPAPQNKNILAPQNVILKKEEEIPKPNKPNVINPKIPVPQNKNIQAPQNVILKKQEAIPKPKGHSRLDYSKWDQVEDDSGEDDEDDEEEQQPQYRFRVRTVGVRSVK